MAVYVLGQLKDYMHADMNYAQTYNQELLGANLGKVKYIYTDVPERKDIELYRRAGIDERQIIGMYQYFTGNGSVALSVKVEDKLEELRKSLSYTNVRYMDSEIRLSRDGFVIASILLDQRDKDYLWGICYFSHAKLLRMEVYMEGLAYVNYYVTAKSSNGLYAKLVRRSFYDGNGSVVFDQILIGEKGRYLFPDGRNYTKQQFIVEFIKQLKLSKEDTVLIDNSVTTEFMQAIFTFGRAARIVAVVHAKHDLIKNENAFYYWFPYSEMLDAMVVSTEGQKDKLIQELKFYNCKTPNIKVAPIDGEFTYVVLHESYKGNKALSWGFKGKADGFLIYDGSGEKICEARNAYQHYFLIEEHKKTEGDKEGYVVKAYVDTSKGKQVTAETKLVYLEAGKYDKPNVSLIIPAYNAEKYIVRTLDNALAQTLFNLEIIVVDDGSTDRTPAIIDWYGEKYSNIMVIHQENKGVAAARNTGIEAAKGEYIGFMDNDDMIHPEMMKRLYDSAKRNDCDVSTTSVYRIKQNGYEKFIQYPLEEDVAITTEDYFEKGCLYWVVIWNKIYRASLVKAHLFPRIVADDNAWSPCVLSYADRICYLNDYSYEWDRSIRTRTQVNDWLEKSKEEYFNDFKETVLFYLENGNPKRMGLLKQLAEKQLVGTGKSRGYDKYEKFWKEIEGKF